MEIYGLNFLYVWLENNSYILFYLGIISVLIFIFSIVGLRLFIIAIPSDYFINKKRVSALRDSSILLWVFYKIFKKYYWLHLYRHWVVGFSFAWSRNSHDPHWFDDERLSEEI